MRWDWDDRRSSESVVKDTCQVNDVLKTPVPGNCITEYIWGGLGVSSESYTCSSYGSPWFVSTLGQKAVLVLAGAKQVSLI